MSSSPTTTPALAPLGALLAGGLSRRYGKPKAFARVAGARIIDRALAALGEVVRDVVVVANDTNAYRGLGPPVRGDERAGNGVLGGIHAALGWSVERGRDGALVVACDMPFLDPGLLRAIVARAGVGDADLVAPRSRGPRGVEPLCAWYGAACRPAIEAQLLREDRRVIGFWPDVRVARLPLERVLEHGEPDRIFLNVNTPEDRERAEALASAAAGAASGGDAQRGEAV